MIAVKSLVMSVSLAYALIASAESAVDYEVFPYDHTCGIERYNLGETTLGGETKSLNDISDMPASDNLAEVLVAGAKVTAVDSNEWDEALSDYAGGTPQASLAMRMTVVDDISICTWMAKSASGWIELAGSASEGAWDIKMEFDYSVNPAQVRYSVRPKGSDNFIVLSNGGDSWLDLARDADRISGARLSGLGAIGSASITSSVRRAYAKINGVMDACSFDYATNAIKIVVNDPANQYGSDLALKVEVATSDSETTGSITSPLVVGANVIDISELVGKKTNCSYEVYVVSENSTAYPDSSLKIHGDLVCKAVDPLIVDGNITLNSHTELNLDAIDANNYVIGGGYKLCWRDTDDKYAIRDGDILRVFDGQPANGIDSYVSYILGIDAQDPEKKPILQVAHILDESCQSFAISNLGVVRADEANVAYKIEACDSLDSEGEITDGLTVALPEAVKYYKLHIEVIPK